MISHPKDQITTIQSALIVTNVIIATGIITLPRAVAKEVGTPDGWISVILGGLMALFFGWVVGKVSQRFPGQSFYQYSQEVAGKFLGRVHGLLLIVFLIVSAGYQARIMGEVIRMYLLDTTPLEVIIISFMCVGVYLTKAGINPIGRISELFFLVIIVLLLFLIIFSFRNFELDNLRPVLGEGFLPVWKGINATALSYGGFELMLALVFFMKEPQKAARSIMAGITIVIPFYTLVVILAIGTLTLEEVKTLTWPMMSVAKAIELPGGFFERFEALFVVLWVMAMYTSFVPFHYTACLGLGQFFKKDHHIFALGLLPLIYMVALYPENLNSVFKLGEYLGYSYLLLGAVMPLYFWMIAKIRRKGID
ncbi:GerAB/ArcD/ProY family transporter [Ammoniphilus sp. YIM 78166]|uniref:GerAB/ArcD/ProY family transporter n=1 Tax=Ammoniphilus sp. YIM 78166 TaxID=1644106 RepID=UPI00106FD0E1|nr:GerAB/ArcD/ProY family transporter [Ammoniphilus sp. YIM 78166]